jgi:nucleotide-binding universal stress UspA family protein
MSGIVVGIDGSDQSRHALEWALGEAALHAVPLRVVAVHQVAIDSWGLAPIRSAADEKERDQVHAAAQQMVDKALGEAGKRPPAVDVTVLSGIPAEVLMDTSRDADLLVLGARGGGGFGRLMLGSVTSQIVHHTACPVTIVPMVK